MTAIAARREGPSPQAMGAIAFVAFLLAGCAFIITAKLWNLAPGWVTFIPVLFMAGYAAACLLLKGLRLRSDQTGDNLYYMGFIFTLTSLGVALYQFTTDASAEHIVRNFGIALASTIAGVAGRVLFNQMRQDPIEVEHTARLELADAARRVRRELDGTAIEMASFRRQMQQMVSEGLDDTGAAFRDAWNGIRESMETASARSAQSIDETAARLSAALQGHVEAVTQDAARLAEAHALTGNTLKGLSKKLSGFQMPADVLEESVRPILARLADVTDRFADANARQTDRANIAIADAGAVAREQAKAVEALLAEVQALRGAAVALAGQSESQRLLVERLDAILGLLAGGLLRDHVTDAQARVNGAVPVAAARIEDRPIEIGARP